MNNAMRLDALAVGDRMEVVAVGGDCEIKSRLEELGLDEGSTVCCLGAAPLGDPRAYEIRGSVIALRQTDARWVFGFGVSHGER